MMPYIKPKIRRFGFEIEAEMSNELMEELKNKDYGKIVSDGSIHLCRNNLYHSENIVLEDLEFVSGVMEFNRAGKIQAGSIFKILEKYRKKKEFHWNSSMGFHVHISFRPKMPVDCWSFEFAEFFAEELEKKFKGVYSTRKRNSYCPIKVTEETVRTGGKYNFINFDSSFREHGTIEFRIFPANRPMVMRKYLYFVFEKVNFFLENSEKFLKKSFEFVEEEAFEKEEKYERTIYGNFPREETVEEIIKDSPLESEINQNN